MNRERPFVSKLVSDIQLPKMFRVRQHFPRPKIEVDKIPDIIASLLSEDKFSSQIGSVK